MQANFRIPGVGLTTVNNAGYRRSILAVQSTQVASQVIHRVGIEFNIVIGHGVDIRRVIKDTRPYIGVVAVNIAWRALNFIIQRVGDQKPEGHISNMPAVVYSNWHANRRIIRSAEIVSNHSTHQGVAAGIFPPAAFQCAGFIPGVFHTIEGDLYDGRGVLAIQSAQVSRQVVHCSFSQELSRAISGREDVVRVVKDDIAHIIVRSGVRIGIVHSRGDLRLERVGHVKAVHIGVITID